MKNKTKVVSIQPVEQNINDTNEVIMEVNDNITESLKELKKRGRKPKGAKIVSQSIVTETIVKQKSSVILHLKCSLHDLVQFNKEIMQDIFTINSSNETSSSSSLSQPQMETTTSIFDDYTPPTMNINQFNHFTTKEKKMSDINTNTNINAYNDPSISIYEQVNEIEINNHKTKASSLHDIDEKLKKITLNMNHNNINKSSACFWCTCDFKTNPIYIPKYKLQETYHVYGCFCSPECAVAHLMNDKIDMSVKFERYALLNNLYSSIFNYTKNILPAPNPYYILDKYYGNLTIQEYRALLKTNKQIFVLNKPFVKIMPEIHRENDFSIIP